MKSVYLGLKIRMALKWKKVLKISEYGWEVIFLRQLLEDNPIIAAVKNQECLNRALESDCEIIFLLDGDMINLKEEVDLIKSHGKKVFVHIDMITGYASNPIVVDYICQNTDVDGIITTKSGIARRAIERKIKVVQRFFMVDSMSLDSALESLKKTRPDAIEIMPGIIPSVIKRMKKEIKIPIIAGGLISEKEQIMEVLKSGGVSISTSREDLWE